MNVRILPPEEWSRLETGMPQVAPLLDPEDVRVIVVESEGEIAASVTLYRATHWEGTWVSPRHKNAGVVRALLTGGATIAKEMGLPWAFVSTDEERTETMLKRLGAVPLLVKTWVLNLDEGTINHGPGRGGGGSASSAVVEG